MAAPSSTARVTPTGNYLDDGWQSFVAFALDPDILIWEKTVKPPGIDSGGAINTTTMHNSRYRTKAAKSLVDITDVTGEYSYAPGCWPLLLAIIGDEGSITVKWPDGAKLDFYGYLDKAEKNALTEGEQPTGTFTIVVTNFDPTNLVEVGPVYTAGSATD